MRVFIIHGTCLVLLAFAPLDQPGRASLSSSASVASSFAKTLTGNDGSSVTVKTRMGTEGHSSTTQTTSPFASSSRYLREGPTVYQETGSTGELPPWPRFLTAKNKIWKKTMEARGVQSEDVLPQVAEESEGRLITSMSFSTGDLPDMRLRSRYKKLDSISESSKASNIGLSDMVVAEECGSEVVEERKAFKARTREGNSERDTFKRPDSSEHLKSSTESNDIVEEKPFRASASDHNISQLEKDCQWDVPTECSLRAFQLSVRKGCCIQGWAVLWEPGHGERERYGDIVRFEINEATNVLVIMGFRNGPNKIYVGEASFFDQLRFRQITSEVREGEEIIKIRLSIINIFKWGCRTEEL